MGARGVSEIEAHARSVRSFDPLIYYITFRRGAGRLPSRSKRHDRRGAQGCPAIVFSVNCRLMRAPWKPLLMSASSRKALVQNRIFRNITRPPQGRLVHNRLIPFWDYMYVLHRCGAWH